jgi:hypothetical protein
MFCALEGWTSQSDYFEGHVRYAKQRGSKKLTFIQIGDLRM